MTESFSDSTSLLFTIFHLGNLFIMFFTVSTVHSVNKKFLKVLKFYFISVILGDVKPFE